MSSVRLKRLFSSVSGGSWGTEPEEGEVSLRCVRGTDFDYPKLRSNPERAPLRGFSGHEVAKRAAGRGDVIIEKSGGGEQQPVGRAVLHDSEEPVMPTNFAARLSPSRDNDPRFVTYLLSALYAKGVTKSSIKQTTGIQNLDLHFFLDTIVVRPQLQEQQAIADFLDAETARIDTLIAKKRRMQAAIGERFEAERARLVRAAFSEHGRTTVRRLVDGVEQGWSPSCEDRVAAPDEWGVLKTGAVTDRVFRPEENKRLPDELDPELRWAIGDGDVLVARGSGSLKRVASAAVASTGGRRLMLSDLIYRLKRPRMDPRLLAHCLNCATGRAHLEGSVRTDAGQTLKIRGEDLLDAPVPAVPADDQHLPLEAIEKASSRAATVARRLSAQLELLAEHRRALITAAVAGQLEIPGIAA